MFDTMGPRYGRVLREAERSVRALNPDFDLDRLTDDTAPLIAELIEATIDRSVFYQRPALRRAACLLIADVYEKQYEALHAIGELRRLEDVYYRLKR